MNIIGLLYHPKIAAAEPLTAEIAAWLQQQSIHTWVARTDEEADIQKHLAQSSLVVVLGGDGSTLLAARLCVPYRVPVFGVNLGKVGFLSEAQPNDWQDRLTKVLNGDYWLETRLMLQASLRKNGRKEVTSHFTALNDIVVGRGRQARVLRLNLRVDGDLVTTYTADALIVATPTGSTAYSMASGGPLLPPQLQNFVVVPVAAHLSLDRALVLHEEAEIAIQVHMAHEAVLMADGQEGASLEDGDVVVVRKHEHVSYFARVETPGYFYRRLMRRLGFSRPQA